MATDPLCGTCTAVDFFSLVYPSHNKHFVHVKTLGKLNQLMERSHTCKLCALVTDTAVRLIARSTNPPSSEIIECRLFTQSFCTTGTSQIHRLFVALKQPPYDREALDTIEFQAFWDIDPKEEHPDIPLTQHDQTLEREHDRQKDRPRLPATLFGSGRKIESMLDVSRVRDWLRRCEAEHGETCRSPHWLGPSEQSKFLKVIDVHRRCIVNAPPDCRYLAVSYVWGDSARLVKCTTSNVGRMQEQFGLDQFELPKTVTDSMTLVENMGEQYLWYYFLSPFY